LADGPAAALALFASLEFWAVLLALAYLLLAIRQNSWCWPAAFAGASLYLVVMFEAGLYVQALLQLFYAAMAVYGWRQWRGGNNGGPLRVVSWQARDHVRPLLFIGAAGALTGGVLSLYTDAAAPWLDAFTGWAAVVTTWMVARKVLQNWHYWFVIDTVLVFLYISQGLWLTAALFVLYLVLVVVGYRQWRNSMSEACA
jgi:nicotinamide mononucleotide transporter